MKQREKTALAPKWNHMCADLPPFVWILRLHCCYRDFQLLACLSLRCCNKLGIIWVPTLCFSFSFLECTFNVVHGNLAQKTAVLWPAFNTHGKTMASLQMVRAGSAVSVDMYHTAPRSAGVLFFLVFLSILALNWRNQVPSAWCLSYLSALSREVKNKSPLLFHNLPE